MTWNNDATLKYRFSAKLLVRLVAALLLVSTALVGTASADWHGHRGGGGHGGRGGWGGGGYYAPGYYPPPVVYGPSIGIALPGVSIGIQ